MTKTGRKKTSKKVDVEKLKELLRDKGVKSIGQLSKDMGYHPTRLSALLLEGEMSNYGIKYIKNFYGISYAEYKYKTPVEDVEEDTIETPQKPQEPTVTISVEELSKVIYQAVYSAISHAWKDM